MIRLLMFLFIFSACLYSQNAPINVNKSFLAEMEIYYIIKI